MPLLGVTRISSDSSRGRTECPARRDIVDAEGHFPPDDTPSWRSQEVNDEKLSMITLLEQTVSCELPANAKRSVPPLTTYTVVRGSSDILLPRALLLTPRTAGFRPYKAGILGLPCRPVSA